VFSVKDLKDRFGITTRFDIDAYALVLEVP
jgi:hypothetical protein